MRQSFAASLLLLGVLAPVARAQVPDSVRTDSLRRARADSVARADLLRAAMEAVAQAQANQPPPQAAPARTGGAYMNIGFVGLLDAGWSSARDIGALQPGDHDPHVRGFTVPNAEMTLDGAVDPYFKGFANIVHKLDTKGETGVELEEMYILTTSLPGNLQLKAGQFLTDFGRQNAQHPHAWAFVDQPLVLNRMFGPEGLRGQGARLSWLAPTSWYVEAMVTVLNSAGGTTSSFRSDESADIHGGIPVERPVETLKDMLVAPRVTTSFELTGTQTLVLGASAAFGPNNSGDAARTRIYGADLYWKWKSPTAEAGFPFVSLQAEVLGRRYDAARRQSAENPAVILASETLRDHGAYAQALWGIKPRVIAGLRGEYANGSAAAFDAPLRADRFRLTPNLTVYPTEFSKIRFQYNYDHRTGLGRDHSFWIQYEFVLGAHAAHKF